MKKFLIGFFLVIFFLPALAQNDAEAVKILDRFSALALSAPSVSMKFSLETVDQIEGTNNSITGSIILSRDKYRLDLTDNIIWFNGETSWSYLPAEKEVTIAKPDKKDNSFQSKPSSVFSVYKKGYKTRLIEERSDVWIIDLYPEDIMSEITRVRLTIGKTLTDLKRLEYKRNDGVVLTIIVSEYNLKYKPDQETFVFKQDKYKGVEVVDMR